MFRAFSRKNLERIKHVWGAGRIWGGNHVQHWLQHPLVQERINIKVSGTAQMNRFEYFLDRYLRGPCRSNAPSRWGAESANSNEVCANTVLRAFMKVWISQMRPCGSRAKRLNRRASDTFNIALRI